MCSVGGACDGPSSTPAISVWQTISLFGSARVLSTRCTGCPGCNHAVSEPGIDATGRATLCFEGIDVCPKVHEFASDKWRSHARAAQRDD